MQKTACKFLTGIILMLGVTAHSAPIISLIKAHQDFLNQNSGSMLNSINETLKNNSLSQVEKENINQLITKAFEVNRGHLKMDAKLPDGLKNISIVTRNGKTKNSLDHIVEVKGNTSSPGLIKTIEFMKYPNQEILNKANASYEWNDSHGGFYLKNKNAGPLEDGLYRLIVVMQNNQTLDMWLPLVDMAINETPKISQPADQETILNHNPEVIWQLHPPLKPMAYKARVSVEAILSNPPNYNWDVQWGLYLNDITRTSATVGREVNGEGASQLARGRYQIMVLQAADRHYGPVRVSTQSSERITLFVR